MDAYRTICVAPPPEIRTVFEAIRELALPPDAGVAGGSGSKGYPVAFLPLGWASASIIGLHGTETSKGVPGIHDASSPFVGSPTDLSGAFEVIW